MFDRFQSSTWQGHTSVFNRVRNGKILKSSIFYRPKVSTQSEPSVFTKLMSREESPNSSCSQERVPVFGRLGKINEVQSVVPSRTKHLSTLDVSTDGSLRVKRPTVVFTGHRANPTSNKELLRP